MKRFTKVALIIAAVVGGIGICCLVGAVAKGLTWRMFANMVTDGRFSFGGQNKDLLKMDIGLSYFDSPDEREESGETITAVDINTKN